MFVLLKKVRSSWPGGLCLALGAGFLARLWYYLDLSRQPFFGYPIVDALTYDRLALQILAGEGSGGFFRPPLYPCFLSGIYAIAGHHQAAVVWVQFLLGLAGVIPAYLLAERWFGRRAAVLSAWVLALYPLRIFFEGELLALTLFGFLFIWGVWFFWSGLEEGSARRLFWAGLIFGWGALARPNSLLVLPFLAVGGYLAIRGSRNIERRAFAVWVGGVILAILPATLHNWVEERRLMPVAANGGINFYLGNHPRATGVTPLPPGLLWKETIQRPIREGNLTLADQERYWWRRSWDVVSTDLQRWLSLLGKKTALFWNTHESSNNKSLGYFTAISPIVRHYKWWFGVLACLAGIGLMRLYRRPGAVFLTWLLLGFTFSVILFFVTARYRLPLVPFLAIPAAAGAREFVKAWREKDSKKVALAMILGTVLGLAVFPPWFVEGDEGIDHNFQMGQVFLNRGEAGKALDHLFRARVANPDSPDVYNSLGAAYFSRKDLKRAEASYLEALKHGEFSEVYYNLGVVYELRGLRGYDLAVKAYRRALEINPLEIRAWANLNYLLEHPPQDL